MPLNFNKEMDSYLSSKRRRKLFSNVKSKVMNKKAVLSYKAANKFGKVREQLKSRAGEVKKKKEVAEKEIKQEDIDKLIDKKGIKRAPREEVISANEGKGGWEEVKLEHLQEEGKSSSDLEVEKRRLQEDLVRIKEKERAEKERLLKLNEENEHRKEAESEEDKVKRLELEEEINVLKEKQKIEGDRLDELRRARKREHIGALKGRVLDIMFKKKPKKEKDMQEEVVKEVRREAKIKEAKRQKEERKIEEPQKEEVKGKEAKEVKKPKKSFLSRFIQIKSAAQVAKEEQELLRQEEESALKDQIEVNKALQHGGEVRSNAPAKGQNTNVLSTLFSGPQMQSSDTVSNAPEVPKANLSTLFPGQDKQEAQSSQPISTMQSSEDEITLDEDYKIKVVRNQ